MPCTGGEPSLSSCAPPWQDSRPWCTSTVKTSRARYQRGSWAYFIFANSGRYSHLFLCFGHTYGAPVCALQDPADWRPAPAVWSRMGRDTMGRIAKKFKWRGRYKEDTGSWGALLGQFSKERSP